MTFRYLLDANTYIQAKNIHYRMNIVPGFWDWLDLHLEAGLVGSIDMVFSELTAGNDELAKWAGERQSRMLAVDDERTQSIFGDIANHVMDQPDYAEPYTSSFLGGADPWLIAKAAVLGAEVITHERKVPSDSKKVKVPNICEVFDVPYRNTYDLMEELSAKLVLEPRVA